AAHAAQGAVGARDVDAGEHRLIRQSINQQRDAAEVAAAAALLAAAATPVPLVSAPLATAVRPVAAPPRPAPPPAFLRAHTPVILQTCWTWDGSRDFIVRALEI